ncbi:MAG: biotin transporter BioY [Spirochaetaceae bacterium]|jgi:biotin transport system substrate-specific component|nr:biotin transporter BioY [Spirochaetaceae bacterium]
MENKSSVKYIVLASLFAALTAVGAYIAVPIGPVPIVLSNLFVLLAGLLLGKKWAPASMGVYLLLGIIGLPVFSGGRSGIVTLIGPTGGFLIGFLMGAFIIALISGIGDSAIWKDILAVIAGVFVIYAIGVPWLKFNLSLDWPKAFTIGMFPFIPGDLLKAAIAVVLVKFIRPQLND